MSPPRVSFPFLVGENNVVKDVVVGGGGGKFVFF
jgi:hypothetical protein